MKSPIAAAHPSGAADAVDDVLILAFENPFKRLRNGGSECMYRGAVALAEAGYAVRVVAVDAEIEMPVGAGAHPDRLRREVFPRRRVAAPALIRALRWPYPVASRFSRELADRLASLDLTRTVVIVEGIQMCAYWEQIRQARPRASILRLHNIESRYHRQLAAAATRGRALLHRLVAYHYQLVERVMKEFDLVLALSEDELDEVRRTDPSLSPRLRLAPPKASGAARPAGWTQGEGTVLGYFGDLSIPANRHGIEWFLSAIWPLVRKRVPDAVFRLAGRGTETISGPKVEGLGFVPSLDGFVHASTMIVIPLRHGAGVKIKTIDAAMFNVPLVCTSTAVEGTVFAREEGRDVLEVHDDPAAFADAIARVAGNPGSACLRAGRALDLARRIHGTDGLVRVVESLLQQAPRGAAPPLEGVQ